VPAELPPPSPRRLTALLEEADANRAMLQALCRFLAPEDLGRRGPADSWSVGNHVAHLAAADRRALLHLAPALAATLFEDDSALDLDAWNQREVQRRRTRTPGALRAEMADLRAQVLTLLTALAPEDLDHEVFFPGDARRDAGPVPLGLWLHQWAKHDLIHARAILRAVPALAAHPDFRAWSLDDPVVDAIERESGIARRDA